MDDPNQNIMIIEQAEGATKVTLNLLESLEALTPQQQDDKNGCVWTLDGWRKYNLKHLRKAFE